MSNYRTFFLPSEKSIPKKKMEKYTQYIVDGVNMSSQVQSLLFEYEQLGFELNTVQPILSTNSSFTYTEGLLVILKKVKS